jgi:hypothetical protein
LWLPNLKFLGSGVLKKKKKKNQKNQKKKKPKKKKKKKKIQRRAALTWREVDSGDRAVPLWG